MSVACARHTRSLLPAVWRSTARLGSRCKRRGDAACYGATLGCTQPRHRRVSRTYRCGSRRTPLCDASLQRASMSHRTLRCYSGA